MGRNAMSLLADAGPAEVQSKELQTLRRYSLFMLIVGVLLIIVGMVAVSSPFIPTLAAVIFVGSFLLVGGVLEVVNAFWAHTWRGFWIHQLFGILYLVLGLFLVRRPEKGAEFFTLMIAAAFVVGGLFRIVTALSHRFHGWVWVLLNGIVTLVLGILIWQEWPESAMWVIGLFVGIDMVFAGMSWVMTALTVRGIVGKPA
jgi:uncharacterized membrane protein HdeD (DUF308 family)